MQQPIHTRLRAALLLVVFSLSTIAGIACSFSMVNSNAGHYRPVCPLCHPHPTSKKCGTTQCCHERVVKLSLVDKSLPGSVQISTPLYTQPAFAFMPSCYLYDASAVYRTIKQDFLFTNEYSPPVPDVPVAFRRLLI